MDGNYTIDIDEVDGVLKGRRYILAEQFDPLI
jgi:hypothetical protein